MKIPIFQVDAFTGKGLKGNPAAVCLLKRWLEDEILLGIAGENNLSETAFCLRGDTGWEIRWFTPLLEVDLCGHATLAAAYVLFNLFSFPDDFLSLNSASGILKIKKEGEVYSLFFPSTPPVRGNIEVELLPALGGDPVEALSGRDYLVRYRGEEDILGLHPDFEALKKLTIPGVIVTARGKRVDFVSRYFAPGEGIPEDPVTGSAHCTLVPYWNKETGLTRFHALQLSSRGGELFCEYAGEKVKISGRVIPYMEGNITL